MKWFTTEWELYWCDQWDLQTGEVVGGGRRLAKFDSFPHEKVVAGYMVMAEQEIQKGQLVLLDQDGDLIDGPWTIGLVQPELVIA